MRKLNYEINLDLFEKIEEEIVPILFTEHQFDLIIKKFSNKTLSQSEKNEFSITISKKMNAINTILEKETDNIFVYREENMLSARLSEAKKFIKQLSRKFKNKHIIISGSFLYKQKYEDIDVFVIEKLEKEDAYFNNFHVSYLTEDVYRSLFFASARKLCISNRKITSQEIKEKITTDTVISLYQELFNDLDRDFEGVKKTLRGFLLQSAFISKAPIPDSQELSQQIDLILRSNKPKEIVKNIFVNSIAVNKNRKSIISKMKNIINSYLEIMKEYPKFKDYYLDIISSFREVVNIAS
mgnify:CR=1 FL=1